ncbi:MAG: VOC family protein [Acidobacteria bacterium]|nr:VOC family protein [Acidobacteriota bacterium]
MAEEASEMAGMPQPKQGSFCWSEIASSDADKTQAFYEAVFGWKFKGGDASNSGMDYREFTTGESDFPAGGLYQINPDWFDGNPPPAHWMTYVAVDDVDANAEKAKALGASVHKVMDVPNVGRIAIMQDPTGAMIATFTAK